ncbi:hypothetical protein FSP39_009646 [Pinctada imbricata]|uniref:Uncharacterized protein n=1 Tax=Pinctada imbricata TaxID=66713 RepID=A0AA88Y331_PINIB|nr:hypothetical protein FSP39_009646 [Pinctada imbricata]
MQKVLKSLAEESHEEYDCLVVCLLSHGDLGKVYGADSELLDIHEVQSYFYADQCPSLAGKPKLFFIQACQGLKKQTGLNVETDGGILEGWEADGPAKKETIIHNRADFLSGFSTTPGDMSVRLPNKGSIYVSILCRLMKEYAKKGQDLLSILTVVNQQVSDLNLKNDSGDPVHIKQVPHPCSTLTKRVVFR